MTKPRQSCGRTSPASRPAPNWPGSKGPGLPSVVGFNAGPASEGRPRLQGDRRARGLVARTGHTGRPATRDRESG
jgi:hypothetical protein